MTQSPTQAFRAAPQRIQGVIINSCSPREPAGVPLGDEHVVLS
jgi:hypothetical protein